MFEVKVTVPKQLLNMKAFEKSITQGINKIVDDSTRDFASTCATWGADDQPKLEREEAHTIGDGITGAVRATGDVYAMVNYGTPAHEISARRVPLLHFRHGSGFVPKTRPNILGSSGGANTGPWVTKPSVSHPGIVARGFDLVIALKHQPRLVKVAEEAIKEITK